MAMMTGGAAQFLAEPGGDLIAVQARQAEIEQHIIRLLAACDLDGLVSVAGDVDIVAVLFKPHRHGLGGIAVVIDDEDIGHIRPADRRLSPHSIRRGWLVGETPALQDCPA